MSEQIVATSLPEECSHVLMWAFSQREISLIVLLAKPRMVKFSECYGLALHSAAAFLGPLKGMSTKMLGVIVSSWSTRCSQRPVGEIQVFNLSRQLAPDEEHPCDSLCTPLFLVPFTESAVADESDFIRHIQLTLIPVVT